MSLNDLIPATVPEFAVFFCAVFLGIIYAFDGWRGVSALKKFKDSWRMLSFKFLLGGFVVSLLADLKGLGIQVDHGRALLCYVEGVFLSAAFVVLAIAGFILISAWLTEKYTPAKHVDIGVNPALLYLQHGFDEYFTERKGASEKKKHDELAHLKEFQQRYFYELAEIQAVVLFFQRSKKEPEERRKVCSQILKSACVVVSFYYKRRSLESEGNIRFKANFMRLRKRSEVEKEKNGSEVLSNVLFVRSGVTYEELLVLYADTSMDLPSTLALPVENGYGAEAEKKSLPGAPLAIKQRLSLIISDTSKLKGYGNEIKSFFESRKIHGLTCLVVTGSLEGKQIQLGVANIECDRPDVFRESGSEEKELKEVLQPYRLLLAAIHEN